MADNLISKKSDFLVLQRFTEDNINEYLQEFSNSSHGKILEKQSNQKLKEFQIIWKLDSIAGVCIVSGIGDA